MVEIWRPIQGYEGGGEDIIEEVSGSQYLNLMALFGNL